MKRKKKTETTFNGFIPGFCIGVTVASLLMFSILLLGFSIVRTPTVFEDLGFDIKHVQLDDITHIIETMKKTDYIYSQEIIPLIDAYIKKECQ